MSVWENVRCAVLWATGHRYAFWKSVDSLPEVRERTAKIWTTSILPIGATFRPVF